MDMTPWDWAMYGVVAFVAITSLVGHMRRRRDQLVREVEQQLAQARSKNKKHKKAA